MLVNTDRLIREYRLGGGALIEALRGVNFSAQSGEVVGILGKSGSGKSTLLNLIGGLDRPTRGSVEVAGLKLHALSPKKLARFRLKTVGFVFQSFHLSPRLRAWENVALPLVFAGVSRSERRKRALKLLESVGLAHRRSSRPGQMSAGEQQRTAIARAMVNTPRLLLADEPTGNLDTVTSEEIMNLLVEQNRKGMTIVMVTHDPELADRYTTRTVRMADGRLVRGEDGRPRSGIPEEGGE
ncbi:MAG: ABC transporter ATP-binding protein [Planctomycetota bacterium]|jgi:putative ABC transport system ATP-binding protein